MVHLAILIFFFKQKFLQTKKIRQNVEIDADFFVGTQDTSL